MLEMIYYVRKHKAKYLYFGSLSMLNEFGNIMMLMEITYKRIKHDYGE